MSHISQILSQNFQVTSTEQVPTLMSLLAPDFSLGQESFTSTLRQIRKRLSSDHPNPGQFKSGLYGGRGSVIIKQAVRDHYGNSRWLDKQTMVVSDINAGDILPRIDPARDVPAIKDLTRKSMATTHTYIQKLVKQVEAFDRRNQALIKLIKRGEFTEQDADEAERLLRDAGSITVESITIPLGKRSFPEKKRPVANRGPTTLPALTRDEIQRLATVLELLVVFTDKCQDTYHKTWSQMFVVDDEGPEPLWDAMEVAQERNQVRLENLWTTVGLAFSPDRAEGIADLTYELYWSALAMAMWIDRSIK